MSAAAISADAPAAASAAPAAAGAAALPPASPDDPWDTAALRSYAQLNARQFRTLLGFMSKGYHFEHAMRLMKERVAAGGEFLTDDVNVALGACVFATEPHMISHLVNQWKKSGRLIGRSDEDMLAEARRVITTSDTGPVVNLRMERYKRSGDVHEDAAARKQSAAAEDGDAAPRKRARMADAAPACSGDDDDTGDAESAQGTDAPGQGKRRGFQPDPPELRDAYKHAIGLLQSTFSKPPGQYAAVRLQQARRILDTMESELGRKPNPRTYVLVLKAALLANDVVYGQEVFQRMKSSGTADENTLYMFAQPTFMRELIAAGILRDCPELLSAPRGSPKWCFMVAAAQAHLGDMRGSKHGAVLVKDGVPLSWGLNHRFGLAGDPHVRVMHAEVHCLVRLSDPAQAKGAEFYIVELDGHGVGYEEAIPCPMCNTGLCELGCRAAHYSCHDGVATLPVRHSPHLQCESYARALRRVYPKSTKNPDPESDAVAATAVPAPPPAPETESTAVHEGVPTAVAASGAPSGAS